MKKIKKITREQLRRWDACYNDERIAELVPEAGLTPLEVAALDIPVEDRMWVLLRENIIPARALRLLACGWAETACHAAGWTDPRSLAAIAVARRFACGEVSAAELDAAEAEARAAARTAVGEATESDHAEAAWASAWSASGEPDWEASTAAEAAARSASEAARWASETAAETQLAAVVQVLKG